MTSWQLPTRIRVHFRDLMRRINALYRNHRGDFLAILLFLLLSFNTLIWFKGHEMIIQIDNIASIINPDRGLSVASYAWRDDDSIGRSSENPGSLTFILFYYLLWTITKDISVTQRVVYILLFFFSLLSMYLFLRKYIFKEYTFFSILSSILISTLYVANPVTLSCFVWYRIEGYTLYYILQPLFLIFLFNIISERNLRALAKKAIIYSLILQLFSAAFTPTTISLLVLVTICLIGVIIITGSSQRMIVLRNIMLFVAFFAVLSSWWLIPYAYSILKTYMIIERVAKFLEWLPVKPLPVAESWSKFTTLINSFSMLGHPYIWFKFKGISLFSWSNLALNNIFFKFASLILALLSIGTPLLLFRYMDNRYRFMTLFFSILCIITLFFMKGLNEPFSAVSRFIFSLWFLTPLTRHYYYKVALILPLCYSSLLSVGIYALRKITDTNVNANRIGKRKSILLPMFILLIVIVSVFLYPFIKGYVIPDLGFINGGPVDIPNDYSTLTNVVSKEYAKVLILPLVWGSTEIAYSWPPHGVKTTDQLLSYFLLNKSVIQYAYFTNPYADRFVIGLSEIFAHTNITSFINMLCYFGFRYIIIHKDVNLHGSLDFVPSPKYYEVFINSYKLNIDERVKPSKLRNDIEYQLNGEAKEKIRIELIFKFKESLYDKESLLRKILHKNLVIIRLHSNENESLYFIISLHMNKFPHMWIWIWNPDNNFKDLIVVPGWVFGVNNWNNITSVIDLKRNSVELYINDILIESKRVNNILLSVYGSIKMVRVNVFPIVEYGYVGVVFDNHRYNIVGSIISTASRDNGKIIELVHDGTFLRVYQLICKNGQGMVTIAYNAIVVGDHDLNKLKRSIDLTVYNYYHNSTFYTSEAYKILYIVKKFSNNCLRNSIVLFVNDNKDKNLSVLEFDSSNSFQQRSAILLYVKRINPTMYIVKIKAWNPFILVLWQSYDPLWMAYVDGKPISQIYHYVAFGSFNAWFINRTGELTIVIRYQGQHIREISFYVFIVTLSFIVVSYFVSKLRSIRK